VTTYRLHLFIHFAALQHKNNGPLVGQAPGIECERRDQRVDKRRRGLSRMRQLRLANIDARTGTVRLPQLNHVCAAQNLAFTV
jgi:hypothetical protein